MQPLRGARTIKRHVSPNLLGEWVRNEVAALEGGSTDVNGLNPCGLSASYGNLGPNDNPCQA